MIKFVLKNKKGGFIMARIKYCVNGSDSVGNEISTEGSTLEIALKRAKRQATGQLTYIVSRVNLSAIDDSKKYVGTYSSYIKGN